MDMGVGVGKLPNSLGPTVAFGESLGSGLGPRAVVGQEAVSGIGSTILVWELLMGGPWNRWGGLDRAGRIRGLRG